MEATSLSTTSMTKIVLLVLMISVNLLVAAANQAAAITPEDNTQDEAINQGACAAECAASCGRSHQNIDDRSASTNFLGFAPIIGRVIPLIPKIIPKIIPRKPLPGIPKQQPRKPDLPDIPDLPNIPGLPDGGQGDPDSCYTHCLSFQCRLTPNPSSLYRCTAGCAYRSVTQLTDADADQVQSYVDSCKRDCQKKN